MKFDRLRLSNAAIWSICSTSTLGKLIDICVSFGAFGFFVRAILVLRFGFDLSLDFVRKSFCVLTGCKYASLFD